jgi:hypothetical protein
MKVVLAGVAFATLMASPPFAQSQSTEGPPHPGDYPDQEKQLRIDYRGLDGSTRKSDRTTPYPEPIKQWPCSSAPGFCSDYRGGNGD